MAAFSMEQLHMRLRARGSEDLQYPLDVPVQLSAPAPCPALPPTPSSLKGGEESALGTDAAVPEFPADWESEAGFEPGEASLDAQQNQPIPSPFSDPWDAFSITSGMVGPERAAASPTVEMDLTEAATSKAYDLTVDRVEPEIRTAKSLGRTQTSAASVPSGVTRRAFEQAHVRLDADLSSLAMPWETPLMKAIFSDDDPTVLASLPPPAFRKLSSVPPVPGPPLPRPKASAREPLLVQGSLALHAIRPLQDEDDDLKTDRLLRQAASRWALVLARYSLEFGGSPPDEEEILACFGARSVHTVAKRASGFLAFLRWFDVVSAKPSSPFCDASFWKYVSFLDQSSAAASTASSFLSSVRFAKHVMGMKSIEEPGRRCVGCAEKLLCRAGLMRQAAPLKVDQIRKIHDLLHDENATRWDRALCAYLLLCLYGRARHSDFKRIDQVEWDVTPLTDGQAEAGHEGYIIIYTRNHKTSRATAKKVKLLPIIVPVAGVHAKPWAFAARAAFEAVGLKLSGPVHGPLFRPPKSFEELALCNRSITSGEVSTFLRVLLGFSAEPAVDVPRISSHSLKRTCLSWSSKAGHDRLTRCCLGRHAFATEGTEAVYSVELGLPHVRKLETLMRFIVQGAFAPDAARARMWAFPPPAAAAELVQELPTIPGGPVLAEPKPGEAADADPGDSSGGEGQSSASTSTSSSSSSSESSDGGNQKRARVAQGSAPVEATGGWVVHRRSQILHRVYRDRMLLCGRPRTDHYQVVPDITRMGNLVCKTCDRNARV